MTVTVLSNVVALIGAYILEIVTAPAATAVLKLVIDTLLVVESTVKMRVLVDTMFVVALKVSGVSKLLGNVISIVPVEGMRLPSELHCYPRVFVGIERSCAIHLSFICHRDAGNRSTTDSHSISTDVFAHSRTCTIVDEHGINLNRVVGPSRRFGDLFISAGYVRLTFWDLRKGGEIAQLTPHSKNITSLTLDSTVLLRK